MNAALAIALVLPSPNPAVADSSAVAADSVALAEVVGTFERSWLTTDRSVVEGTREVVIRSVWLGEFEPGQRLKVREVRSAADAPLFTANRIPLRPFGADLVAETSIGRRSLPDDAIGRCYWVRLREGQLVDWHEPGLTVDPRHDVEFDPHPERHRQPFVAAIVERIPYESVVVGRTQEGSDKLPPGTHRFVDWPGWIGDHAALRVHHVVNGPVAVGETLVVDVGDEDDWFRRRWPRSRYVVGCGPSFQPEPRYIQPAVQATPGLRYFVTIRCRKIALQLLADDESVHSPYNFVTNLETLAGSDGLEIRPTESLRTSASSRLPVE